MLRKEPDLPGVGRTQAHQHVPRPDGPAGAGRRPWPVRTSRAPGRSAGPRRPSGRAPGGASRTPGMGPVDDERAEALQAGAVAGIDELVVVLHPHILPERRATTGRRRQRCRAVARGLNTPSASGMRQLPDGEQTAACDAVRATGSFRPRRSAGGPGWHVRRDGRAKGMDGRQRRGSVSTSQRRIRRGAGALFGAALLAALLPGAVAADRVTRLRRPLGERLVRGAHRWRQRVRVREHEHGIRERRQHRRVPRPGRPVRGAGHVHGRHELRSTSVEGASLVVTADIPITGADESDLGTGTLTFSLTPRGPVEPFTEPGFRAITSR